MLLQKKDNEGFGFVLRGAKGECEPPPPPEIPLDVYNLRLPQSSTLLLFHVPSLHFLSHPILPSYLSASLLPLL